MFFICKKIQRIINLHLSLKQIIFVKKTIHDKNNFA